MGMHSYLGEPSGPRYEAWSAYVDACAKVEKTRKAILFSRLEAGEGTAINPDLDRGPPLAQAVGFPARGLRRRHYRCRPSCQDGEGHAAQKEVA